MQKVNTYEELVALSMATKGYVCPGNDWDTPEFENTPVIDICTDCPHFKKDCIVYGTESAKKKWQKKEAAFAKWRKNQPKNTDEITLWAVFNAMDDEDKH